MFDNWNQVIDKLTEIENSVFDLIDETFKTQSVQKTTIEFNQYQLQAGEDALGQTINTIGGSPYKPYTVVIRRSKGLPTNLVTLEDTGEFYKTFRVIIVKDGYEITANFQKEDGNILDNFSSTFDFLGLQEDSLTELVREHVYPLLYQLLRKKFNV